jgi:glycine cleavage system H protein
MVKVADYEVAENLYYHKKHVWAKIEDEKIKIGITDFAQKQFTDIVYVELPGVGEVINQNEPFGILESVEDILKLVAPVSGTIEAVNQQLESNPDLISEDPFGEGWFLVVAPTNLDSDLEVLMNFDAAVEWHKKLTEEGSTEQ